MYILTEYPIPHVFFGNEPGRSLPLNCETEWRGWF